MDIERYVNIKSSEDFKLYTFISNGPKGELVKVIKFSAFPNIEDTHNLALGTRRGRLVDYTETTNNNDRDKILATIFHIARLFNREYHYQKIFITGRNDATKRLYRGAINHEYSNIIREYIIYGVVSGEADGDYSFELFAKNKQYDAFLFERVR